MFLQNCANTRLAFISSALLFMFSYCSWKSYQKYKSLKCEYLQKVLFQKRHNCVVMYAEKEGMSGWPPKSKRIKTDITENKFFDQFHEPVIYFLNTAKSTLDVAFMLINIKQVYEALLHAQGRGVKVRLLLNFEHCDSTSAQINEIVKQGVEVLTYISPEIDMGSIMHYKFMVKDYTESNGYVLMGSLNLTNSGFFNNYENLVFTSDRKVVSVFHTNFEDCWNFVKLENRSLINKNILSEANLA